MNTYFQRSATSLSRYSAAVLVSLCACAPRLAPLQGVAPINGVLPAVALPPAYRQVVFTWELEQNSMVARGNGVARLAPPDSARVDLTLTGGFGGASAILVGDSLRVPPGADMGMGSMIPPPPLLWAALGRLALPAVADTVIRVSGDTTAANVGRPVQWRVTAVGNRLTELDHVAGDHIVESVEHRSDGEVRYESSDHRSLVLHIKQDVNVPAFDASIWHF